MLPDHKVELGQLVLVLVCWVKCMSSTPALIGSPEPFVSETCAEIALMQLSPKMWLQVACRVSVYIHMKHEMISGTL